MTQATLDAIFDAERTLRVEEQKLLSTDPRVLRSLLLASVEQARALPDRKEASMRLERLADLCAQVEGPEMVDALIVILDDDSPTVRVQAAEALVDVAFERYAEVARGVERALERTDLGQALRELPWVIGEVAEPSARGLIARFLRLPDADAVASAIEALATLGDPAAADDLQALLDDEREVELEDDDELGSATLGELAQEAIDALTPDDDE